MKPYDFSFPTLKDVTKAEEEEEIRKLTLEKLRNELKLDSNSITSKSNSIITDKPHTEWKLIADNKRGYITRDGKIVYTFPNSWSRKFTYFKCLWDNFKKKVEYKEIFEFGSKRIYPKKDIWRTNRNTRNEINKLRKELNKLPFLIETSKGFLLTTR